MTELCMWSVLVLSSIYDFVKKKIPVLILGVGGVVAMVATWYRSPGAYEWVLDMMPGFILLLLAAVSREKIGYGDGLLILVLGLMEGWKSCLIGVVVALFLVSGCSIFLLILKKVTVKTEVAFTPFLLVAHMLLALSVG